MVLSNGCPTAHCASAIVFPHPREPAQAQWSAGRRQVPSVCLVRGFYVQCRWSVCQSVLRQTVGSGESQMGRTWGTWWGVGIRKSFRISKECYFQQIPIALRSPLATIFLHPSSNFIYISTVSKPNISTSELFQRAASHKILPSDGFDVQILIVIQFRANTSLAVDHIILEEPKCHMLVEHQHM